MRLADQSPEPDACHGSWRHLRAAPVSLIALALGVFGHLLGGGQAPNALTFLLVWAIAAALSWSLSDRRFTVVPLAGVLIAVQAVMHLICLAEPGAASHHHGDTISGPTMLMGHAAATLIAVTVLRFGEHTLWNLLDALLLTPARLVFAAPIVASRPWPIGAYIEHMRTVPVSQWLLRNDPVRGPPLS